MSSALSGVMRVIDIVMFAHFSPVIERERERGEGGRGEEELLGIDQIKLDMQEYCDTLNLDTI